MIKIKDKEYELKFNLKRAKLIEAAVGKSILEATMAKAGIMTISDLEAFYAYGLKEAGADEFLKPKAAIEVCDEIIEENSYAQAVLYVQEALKRDLGFLFRLRQ